MILITGTQWSEDEFRNDPPVTNLDSIVSPANSTVRLIGPTKVRLGDAITLHIELYDVAGNKRKGGDLVSLYVYYFLFHAFKQIFGNNYCLYSEQLTF